MLFHEEKSQDMTDNFFKELTKEYGGLNLNFEQMIMLKSLGINREQYENIIKSLSNLYNSIHEMLEKISNALSEIIKNDDIINLLKRNESKNIERNKKGKRLKPWENKRFYQ